MDFDSIAALLKWLPIVVGLLATIIFGLVLALLLIPTNLQPGACGL
jgi:hypothetical protein